MPQISQYQKERSPTRSEASESVNTVSRLNRLSKQSIHPKHFKPQTLSDSSPTRCELMGSVIPERQEYDIELLANMGSHRALPASLNGTTGTGEPSTRLGYTSEERAVALTLNNQTEINYVF